MKFWFFINDLRQQSMFIFLLFVSVYPSTILWANESTVTAASTEQVIKLIKGDKPYFVPQSLDNLPNDKYGVEVELGFNIFTKTAEYASRYVGNGLTCSNCHLDGGRQANAAPLWGAFGMYPAYRSRDDRSINLEERIQQCFKFSLNGFAPAVDAPEIRALLSYMHFISKGVPVGTQLPGRGFPQVMKTGYDPNPTRGESTYAEKCAHCHGNQGEGKKEDETYIYPPLWGMNSYNKAAGFSRIPLLAGFIRANMPFGQGWSLTDQESLDLAAYINLQLRPWDPREGFFKSLFN